MRTNTTKAKLNEGEVVFGAIITRYAPDMVEIFGALGYDFVMIDCEHGPADLDQVEHMVRAAESFGITPIARVPDHHEQTILRYLDRGLQGVIVPHVNTGEQAAAVARAARYYPDGYRGMGGGRAQDYGIGVTRDEATAWINSQVLVIPWSRTWKLLATWTTYSRSPGPTFFTWRLPTWGRAWAIRGWPKFAG